MNGVSIGARPARSAEVVGALAHCFRGRVVKEVPGLLLMQKHDGGH